MSKRRINLVLISILLNALLIKLVLPHLQTLLPVYITVYMLSYLLPGFIIIKGTNVVVSNIRLNDGNILTGIYNSGFAFAFLIIVSAVFAILFPQQDIVAKPTLYNIIIAGVIGPVFEELFWRGCVYKSLSRHGTLHAMLISSLLFACMHNGVGGFIVAFIAGFLFSYLCYRTSSIFFSTVLHILNNVIAILSSVYPFIVFITVLCSLLVAIVLKSLEGKAITSENGDAYTSSDYAIFKCPLLYVTYFILIVIRVWFV